jgi:hypothetical protein
MRKNEQAESSQTLNLAVDEFRDSIRASLDSRVREFAPGCAGALILEEIEMLCGKTGEQMASYSAFSNPRSQLNRIKRSGPQTDQALRWVGSLLLSQEEQFRKVRHSYP